MGRAPGDGEARRVGASRGGTAPGVQIATHMSLQPQGLKGVEARRETRRDRGRKGGKRRIQTDIDPVGHDAGT